MQVEDEKIAIFDRFLALSRKCYKMRPRHYLTLNIAERVRNTDVVTME